jgi:HK97 family phage major capsid protein
MPEVVKDQFTEEEREFLGGLIREAVTSQIAPIREEQVKWGNFFLGSRTKTEQEEVGKGIRLARFAKVLLNSRASMGQTKPTDVAKAMYPKDLLLHEKVGVYFDPAHQKSLGESLGSAGGFIVPPEYAAEIIPFLRDMTVVRKAGARVVPMASNTLLIPRGESGSTATYVGESANIGVTKPGLGMIQLSARKLAAIVPISNELIRDSSPAADAWVRDDLVTALAVREDLAFLRGDGTQYQPKGLRHWVDAAGVTTANPTVNLANTVADIKTSLVKFKQGRKGRIFSGYWFMSTRTEQYLMHLVTGAPERYFFRDELLTGKFFSYPYAVTDQIPDNLGGASNGSELYLADMFEAVIGENQNLELAVSQEAAYDEGGTIRAAFSLDQTVLRAVARHDFALRYGRAAHVLDDVRWS